MRRAFLFLLLLGACRGLERDPILPLAEDAPGFPARAGDGELLATALLPTNHAETLGEDLTAREVLPVAVRLGLREGVETPTDVDRIDAELLLADGTVLRAIESDRVARNEPRLIERLALLALRVGPLAPFERAPSRFLYFRLGPETRVRGRYALVRTPSLYREVDLLRSLLVLEVATQRGSHEIRVGLSAGPWSAGS